MKASLVQRIPIESFIVRPHSTPHQVVALYFDASGARHEAVLAKKDLDDALSQLDGRPRAIARSTGGMVMAQPFQLVLHHAVNETTEPRAELRIKVRFKDFAVNQRGKVGPGVTMVTKNILPQELHPEVAYDLKSMQKFLIDFGQGALPVAIFSFQSSASGENLALFVDAAAVDQAIRAPAGGKVSVQRYRITKELVRIVREPHTLEVFGKAHANFEKLKASGSPVPSIFQIGEPVELPTGLSFQMICEFLRQPDASSLPTAPKVEREERTLAEAEKVEDGAVSSDFLLFMEPL